MNRLRISLRRLARFEALETRLPLAGDVTAVVSNGVLRLEGDELANDVVIDQVGLAAHQFRVSSGASATTINNNAAPQIFSFVTRDIRAELGDGSDILAVNGVIPLSVSLAHARFAGLMPGEHRDPFDRLLAAQAEIEGVPLVTADPAFRAFGTRTLW